MLGVWTIPVLNPTFSWRDPPRPALVDAGREPAEFWGRDGSVRTMAGQDDGFEPDPERVRLLQEIADDVRGDSPESKQVAALLYRVSDIYQDGEDTTPRDVYVNMRNILRVKEQGGKDPDPEGLED